VPKFNHSKEVRATKNLGFTLVELLVVLVISLTVISISTVAYNKLSTNAYLKSSSRHIAASLRYARSYAVSRGKEAHLKIDLENRSYSYTGNSKIFKFKNGIDLKVYSATTFGNSDDIAEIRFAPDGSSSGGRVTLSNRKKSYVIYVDWLTGQVGIDG
jgi:general secretion pathway protein H